MVLAGLSAAWLLGFGLGMCLMALSIYFPVTDQLVPILLRPMFFCLRPVFRGKRLTDGLRDYLLPQPAAARWNRCVMAGSWLSLAPRRLQYLAGWILALVYLGLLLERFARRRVELA